MTGKGAHWMENSIAPFSLREQNQTQKFSGIGGGKKALLACTGWPNVESSVTTY